MNENPFPENAVQDAVIITPAVETPPKANWLAASWAAPMISAAAAIASAVAAWGSLAASHANALTAATTLAILRTPNIEVACDDVQEFTKTETIYSISEKELSRQTHLATNSLARGADDLKRFECTLQNHGQIPYESLQLTITYSFNGGPVAVVVNGHSVVTPQSLGAVPLDATPLSANGYASFGLINESKNSVLVFMRPEALAIIPPDSVPTTIPLQLSRSANVMLLGPIQR